MCIPLDGCTGGYACRDSSACISIFNTCDGQNDCTNGDDEKHCDHVYFKCNKSNTMIYKYSTALCDGHSDCPDGEDESNCRPCPGDQFACYSDKTTCIDKSNVCNFVINCPGGEDERNCSICTDEQVPCRYASILGCIDRGEVCNGREYFCQILGSDGSFHSDETNCSSCGPRAHRCRTESTCIHESAVCDGTVHCSDQSDEDECDICPSDRPFKCPGTTMCLDDCDFAEMACSTLSMDSQCQAKAACITLSMDVQCQALAMCQNLNITDLFWCDAGTKCVNPYRVCNEYGQAECSDGTDQSNCHSKSCPVG